MPSIPPPTLSRAGHYSTRDQSGAPARRNSRFGGLTWTAMTEEARSIWAREGVAVFWDSAGTGASATVRLPVSFDDHFLGNTARRARPYSDYDLRRTEPANPHLGTAGARLAMAAAGGLSRPDTTMAQDSALGLLLGRVLAHEIGHAYRSDESGTPEVYVRPYPEVERRREQISVDRGRAAPPGECRIRRAVLLDAHRHPQARVRRHDPGVPRRAVSGRAPGGEYRRPSVNSSWFVRRVPKGRPPPAV